MHRHICVHATNSFITNDANSIGILYGSLARMIWFYNQSHTAIQLKLLLCSPSNTFERKTSQSFKWKTIYISSICFDASSRARANVAIYNSNKISNWQITIGKCKWIERKHLLGDSNERKSRHRCHSRDDSSINNNENKHRTLSIFFRRKKTEFQCCLIVSSVCRTENWTGLFDVRLSVAVVSSVSLPAHTYVDWVQEHPSNMKKRNRRNNRIYCERFTFLFMVSTWRSYSIVIASLWRGNVWTSLQRR